jgi:hypothetical protein
VTTAAARARVTTAAARAPRAAMIGAVAAEAEAEAVAMAAAAMAALDTAAAVHTAAAAAAAGAIVRPRPCTALTAHRATASARHRSLIFLRIGTHFPARQLSFSCEPTAFSLRIGLPFD